MTKGKRAISTQDRAIFWQAINSGIGVSESARMAGISYPTALKWVHKSKELSNEIAAEKLVGAKTARTYGGSVEKRLAKNIVEADNLPPVIPLGRLSVQAQRGLDDFDFFRRTYLGRVPSTWQVDAAYNIVLVGVTGERIFGVELSAWGW